MELRNRGVVRLSDGAEPFLRCVIAKKEVLHWHLGVWQLRVEE
jgi:hypothetical protein